MKILIKKKNVMIFTYHLGVEFIFINKYQLINIYLTYYYEKSIFENGLWLCGTLFHLTTFSEMIFKNLSSNNLIAKKNI